MILVYSVGVGVGVGGCVALGSDQWLGWGVGHTWEVLESILAEEVRRGGERRGAGQRCPVLVVPVEVVEWRL